MENMIPIIRKRFSISGAHTLHRVSPRRFSFVCFFVSHPIAFHIPNGKNSILFWVMKNHLSAINFNVNTEFRFNYSLGLKSHPHKHICETFLIISHAVTITMRYMRMWKSYVYVGCMSGERAKRGAFKERCRAICISA